jgi:hypothetical protein
MCKDSLSTVAGLSIFISKLLTVTRFMGKRKKIPIMFVEGLTANIPHRIYSDYS